MEHKRKRRLPANWRDRLIITELDNKWGDTIFSVMFKKNLTPKGFSRNIGTLTVSVEAPHYCESEIDEYFCKRGLGTLLYISALNHYGSLTTSYHSTSQAARGLWRSLIRQFRYKTDFFKCQLTIFAH